MVLHTLRVFTYNLYTPFRQDGHRLFLRIVYSSSHMWALTPAGLFPQQTPVKHVNWGSSKKRTCPAWNVAMINTPVCFPLSTTRCVWNHSLLCMHWILWWIFHLSACKEYYCMLHNALKIQQFCIFEFIFISIFFPFQCNLLIPRVGLKMFTSVFISVSVDFSLLKY